MAHHERHCDQRGSNENPRYSRPRYLDCQAHLAAVLPGVPAASAQATNLSPDSVGMLTRGHRLTPRQPVEYCKNRRELGIRCGQFVGHATQRPLLPCTQAHSRHLRQAAPGRCTRSGSPVLPFPTSSRRLTESSMVRAAVSAVGEDGNHADFGHEQLAFTEPVARQPDHLLHYPVPRPLALAPPGTSAAHLPHRRTVARCSQRCGADAPGLPPSHAQVGGGPKNEHAAEYPGTFTPLLLPLLHDFPDPGRSHRFPGSSPPSDTWGFKSLGTQAPGFGEHLRAGQHLRASVSRSPRRTR